MNLRYIAIIICTFSLLIASYVGIYNIALGDSGRPDSVVKELIAASIREKKIMIIGGSSSKHGIDNALLEKKLGLPVINMTFTGTLSIDYRLYQIEKYADKGDIIILPLEWEYYFREKETKEHYKSTVRYFGDYFRSLPLLTKADTLLHTSPEFVIEEALKVLTKSEKLLKERQSEELSIKIFFTRIKKCPMDITCLDEYGGSFNTKALGSNVKIPKREIIHRVISNRFKKALAKLSYLKKERGLEIIFTHPPYVSSQNYFSFDNKNDYDFLESIKNELHKYGFKIVGNVTNYIYNINDMQNTYYHLKESRRKRHTQLLIADILDANILTPSTCAQHRTPHYALASLLNGKNSLFVNEYYAFHPIKLLNDNEVPPNFVYHEAKITTDNGISLDARREGIVVNGYANKPSIKVELNEIPSDYIYIIEMDVELPENRQWYFLYKGNKNEKFSHSRRVSFKAFKGIHTLRFILDPTKVVSSLRIDYGSQMGKYLLKSIKIAKVKSEHFENSVQYDYWKGSNCRKSI